MTQDKIKNYIVCINGGSGVIFQPMDEEFSYILTATHVFDDIKDYKNKVEMYFYNESNNEFELYPKFKLIKGENYFPHPNTDVDISILKINRINNENKLIISSDFDNKGDYSLIGFPGIRREKKKNKIDWISDEKIERFTLSKTNDKREAEFNKAYTYEEIEGHSGGGIFKYDGEYVHLIGIENKIPVEGQTQARIEFTPIVSFKKITDDSKGFLEDMLPFYMKNFSFLKEDVFQLPVDLITKDTINKITNVLKAKTKEIIESDYTPNCIKDFLGDNQLLISGQSQELIYESILWCKWLELITIYSIAKEKKCTKSEFEKIFSEIRLLHSNTNSDFWMEHLEDISKTNFGNLSKDGIVIVSSKGLPHKDHYVLSKDSIPDIDRIRSNFESENIEIPYGKEEINVANATNFPYDKYKFVHIEYFKQKLLVDNYKEYTNKNFTDILKHLKEKYEEIIK